MIVFIGSKEKGFFCEEIAEKRQMKMEYVNSELHIEKQANLILRHKEEAKFLVYDLEQYVDAPEEIVKWIVRIQEAIGVKTIIYAAGYTPQSNVVQLLYQNGIKNYIFSVYLGDQKEDLTLCLDGYYESFGYEEKRGLSFNPPPEEDSNTEGEKSKAVCIGVAGAITRMGTTTQAIQLVKYFQYYGLKAAYVQMNKHSFVENLKEAYEQVIFDENLGKVTYAKVDMFYRVDKLQDVLKLDYDYLVFDYGVYSENGFNKISFLEKEIQIFVVGSKPGGEFEATCEVVKNNFYNNVYYIFNFVAKSEQKDLIELMAEKGNMTYFAGDAKDPFSFSAEDSIYESLVPINAVKVKTVVTEKRRTLFGRRKK